jgi:hypothetical protein
VAFSQKTLRNAGAIGTPIEEEGWLDEAIAHLAEDLHGFSRSNIDYRVSAFLSQPERYQLVVEDYFAADLFRSHGHRGATYLFLRWCVDQYGPDLLPVLIRSRQRGITNLEEATGCSFAELYRRWSVALIRSGVEASPEGMTKTSGGYHSIDIRAPMDGWQLAGPRTTRLVAGGPLQHWNAMGTSSHFVEVRSRHAGAVELDVSGPPDAELQVTAFVLPADLASLDLDVRTLAGPEGQRWMRAVVRNEGGAPVRLAALSWELLTPLPDLQTQGFRRGRLDMLGIASSFGTAALSTGAVRHSRPIRMGDVHPETEPIVVKAIGVDAQGRRIAAWAELNGRLSDAHGEDDQPLAENEKRSWRLTSQ